MTLSTVSNYWILNMPWQRRSITPLYVPLKDSPSLICGKDGVKPSISLSSLKLFSAQQCAHARYALNVFFREVTFCLYLKISEWMFLSVSLSLFATHLLLSIGPPFMNMHFFRAHWSPLTPSTDNSITPCESQWHNCWLNCVQVRYFCLCCENESV